MRKVSSLLQGEVRIKYPDPCIIESCKDGARYYSLDRFSDGDSVKDVMTEHDYPITPEYVESFQASTDYRNDVQSAVLNPPRGSYADLTGIQDVCRMTPEELNSFTDYLAQVYSKKNSVIDNEDDKEEGQK